jgi:hypothetical protein
MLYEPVSHGPLERDHAAMRNRHNFRGQKASSMNLALMIFCRSQAKCMLEGNANRSRSRTYLFGGGDDILRPPSEGLLSPTDMFLASTDGSLPVATLSLRIVSSAGAVLN